MKRYIDKMKMINDVDPYFRMEKRSAGDANASIEWMNWPNVSYMLTYTTI